MDHQPLIDEIARQADDFLADADNREEARAAIMEILATDYPQLDLLSRDQIAADVMSILDEEGFFQTAPGGGWTGEPADGEPA